MHPMIKTRTEHVYLLTQRLGGSMTLSYPPVGSSMNGPGLSPEELRAVKYLGIEVVNARRRGAADFDVEVDYVASNGYGDTGLLPIVLLLHEWTSRPREVAALVQDAGGPEADKVVGDWGYVLDLDHEQIVAVAWGVWALVVARSGR